MEVDQPITENGLSKMSPTNVVETADDSEIGSTESVQQNGKSHKNGLDVATSAASAGLADDDSNEAKGLEDEDTMERLMYTELDDCEEEVQLDKPADELVQNLSDTLIEDIIQLNKDSKRAESDTEADPDRLEQNEESSDIPPSSSGQSSNQTAAQEADGEDTNGPVSAMEDESSIGVEEDFTCEIKGVADIDEESESILLQEEDNHDLVDDLDVDENLLLDEDIEMEEGGSTQGSAIQIDDSVAVCEIAEGSTVEVTDGSVTIDESGLSILNTAAVDIGDMTVDDSVEVNAELKSAILVSSDVDLAAVEESVELSTETTEVNDGEIMAPPPLNLLDDLDPPSPDISDLIKFPDVSEKAATSEKTEEKEVIPEVSDLIKFPDDSCADSQQPARSPTPELSDLIKFDSVTSTAEEKPKEADETIQSTSEETLVEEATMETSERVEVKIPEISEVAKNESKIHAQKEEGSSEEKEQQSVTLEKEVEEGSDKSSKQSPEDMPAPPQIEETEEKPTDEEKSECKEVEKTVASEKAEDGDKKEENEDNADSDDDEAQEKKDVCPQALQAADEEDLLEMMEEPERMDADDEQPEDDLDDNSSESGSTKQNEEGEEDDDFEGSDYMGADEDESSRNVDDQEEATGEDIQVEEQECDEGEPPKKRKCSVDVRDVQEEPDVDAEKKKDEDIAEKKDEKSVEETAEKTAEEKVEKADEGESPKLAEIEAKKSEGEDKVENEAEVSTEPAEKKSVDEVSSQLETTEKEDSKAKSEDSKLEDVVQSEKEDEKMDISKEDSLVVEKSTDDVIAKVDESSETEKKLDTENKEEKQEEVKIDEKSEAVPEEKGAKKDEEVSKKEELKEVAASESKEVVKEVEKLEDKDQKPAEKTNDEVLVIDDDDDEVAVPKKEDNAEKKAEKRPCPEDDTEEKNNSETVKKIRLSVDEKEKKEDDKPEEQKEEPKAEVVEIAKKEEKKSALDLIEPIKVTLEPEPVAPKEKKTIRLEFLEKFKKPLEKMNRSNLEDFVLQKIVEGIAFKSAIAEMRTQLDAQDTLLQGYRQKVHDLNKQFRDLEMVHERVVKDLEKKNQHFITPVKITRAVGLQVSQPRFVAGSRPSVGSAPSVANSPKNTVNRSPVATPPGGSPNKNAPQNNVQIRRPRINSVPSTAATQKSPAQQSVVARPGAPTILNKSLSSPQNSLLNKPATLQSQVTPITNTQQSQMQATLTTAQTPANPGVTTPMSRKKPLQKFTPMRPPLSITQQVQQQQQTRQMQEQLMRQQIQEVQTSNTGGQSPLAQSPQGSPLTRTPEPASSPSGTPVSRPQMVMKKVITPQAKPTPTGMQAINRPTPSMVQSNPTSNVRTAPAPSPATVDNSLIDLTDEDDVPKPAAAVAPAPAVVPKPPITILNGQQQQQHHQYGQRQPGMPPLVVINQQRMMTRPTLQQRPAGMVNGAPPRPVLMQRPATNGYPRQTTYRARMINGQIGAPRGMIVRAPIRQPAAVTYTHPAPLPQPGTQLLNPSWKQTPPRPSIRINNIETGIVISWTMDDLSDAHATIVSYQIYAYQETNAPPSMDMWRHVGDVKAMLLPMAVTLTQFQEGQRYHFAVRAVDEHQRVGQFSPPRTWNESTPAKA